MALEVQHILEKLGMHGAVCPVWEGPDQATFTAGVEAESA